MQSRACGPQLVIDGVRAVIADATSRYSRAGMLRATAPN
jgi:hypothetical protein